MGKQLRAARRNRQKKPRKELRKVGELCGQKVQGRDITLVRGYPKKKLRKCGQTPLRGYHPKALSELCDRKVQRKGITPVRGFQRKRKTHQRWRNGRLEWYDQMAQRKVTIPVRGCQRKMKLQIK